MKDWHLQLYLREHEELSMTPEQKAERKSHLDKVSKDFAAENLKVISKGLRDWATERHESYLRDLANGLNELEWDYELCGRWTNAEWNA